AVVAVCCLLPCCLLRVALGDGWLLPTWPWQTAQPLAPLLSMTANSLNSVTQQRNTRDTLASECDCKQSNVTGNAN
ncbi:hypothetical protein BC831DRAFT_462037, partial [Entophlyctis helioformis]